MKFRIFVPTLLFWVFTHADHGNGLWTSMGLYLLPDTYHQLIGWAYEGINPIVFVLIMTSISYVAIILLMKLASDRKTGNAKEGETS